MLLAQNLILPLKFHHFSLADGQSRSEFAEVLLDVSLFAESVKGGLDNAQT